MKFRLKRSLVLVAALATAVGGIVWFFTPDWAGRCYSRIRGELTLEQVREIMGQDEDQADERTTETGEFERSWTFGDARITVVFDNNGRCTYKEFAPSFCGVTPLMGKLIPKDP